MNGLLCKQVDQWMERRMDGFGCNDGVMDYWVAVWMDDWMDE